MIQAKKSLGQHWLQDLRVLSSICATADVRPGDVVLEIGPGHGTLTQVLLNKGAKVFAVELDHELANELQKNIKSENLTVIKEDILRFDLTSLPSGYKVVANIPYYLTSKLIRNLSESAKPPSSVTLLVQKEVAQRICAKPGDMSILGVSAQTYFQCSLGQVVLAEKFDPPPKVDSQVVHMISREKPLFSEVDKKLFFRVVKAGFSNRRKTLQNSLSGGLHIDKQVSIKVLQDSNINPDIRPQELSVNDWFRLVNNYQDLS